MAVPVQSRDCGKALFPAEIEPSCLDLARAVALRSSDLSHQALNPDDRRAGGVYYTPVHIVDYVVERTVGRLLGVEPKEEGGRGKGEEGKAEFGMMNDECSPIHHSSFIIHHSGDSPISPANVANLRILDPACGCGCFLVGAYQYLLDWHRDWYLADGPERHTRPGDAKLCRGRHGQWRLTTGERKRILFNNIYGVDIDPQAVEVAKLALLLRAQQREAAETPSHRLSVSSSRALAALDGNIKCGNALIGPDFCAGQRPVRYAQRLRRQINPFDWHDRRHGFGRIMSDGGFHAVIGNPPWGQKSFVLADNVKAYLRANYVSLTGILDIFRAFVEKAIRLARPGGLWGMVLPDVILLKDYPQSRLFMLENLALSDIRWWGMAFDDAMIDAVTMIGTKAKPHSSQRVRVRVDDSQQPIDHEMRQSDFLSNARYAFNLHLTREKRAALAALGELPKLGDFFEIHEGVHSGNMRAELFVDAAIDDSCRPMYFGRDEIAPYRLQWNGRYVRLGVLPTVRTKTKYANAGQSHWHERRKVLVRRTGDRVIAAVDQRAYYASNNFFLLLPKFATSLDLFGLCALLNSFLATWYFRTVEPRRGRPFSELKIKHLRTFPLPPAINLPAGCKALNALGKRRASASRRLARARSANFQEECDRLVHQLDDTINDCVALLLGLKLNGH
jgi:hypothetical protein